MTCRAVRRNVKRVTVRVGAPLFLSRKSASKLNYVRAFCYDVENRFSAAYTCRRRYYAYRAPGVVDFYDRLVSFILDCHDRPTERNKKKKEEEPIKNIFYTHECYFSMFKILPSNNNSNLTIFK